MINPNAQPSDEGLNHLVTEVVIAEREGFEAEFGDR